MAALTGKTPANTYKDLLQVSNANAGIDSVLRYVEDGEGTQSGLKLAANLVDGLVKPTGATVAIDFSELFASMAINVLSHGAVGDGSHDDTDAINEAMLESKDRGGGVVWMPAGKTFMYDQLVLQRNVLLLGAHPFATKLRQIPGSDVDGIISENMADLIDTGKSFGDGGTYQSGTIVTDTRVPSWFGVGNCYIDANAANQSAGWAIKTYGNFFMSPGVTVVQNGKDGGVWVEASDDFAYNDSNVGAQEEASVNYLLVRNCGGPGLRWRAHDSDIKSVLAYDNAAGNIFFEYSAGKYNGGCNVSSAHSYFNIDNGVGMVIDATVTITQAYIDNDNMRMTTKSNGSSIAILKGINSGFLNQDALTIEGSYINIGQLNMSAINTSAPGVNLVNITGEFVSIRGGYVNCSQVTGDGITGVMLRGTHNTVELKVANAAAAGSVGFDVGGSNQVVRATVANCATGVVYQAGGFDNRIEINGFQNSGQVTFVGTPTGSDLVTILGTSLGGSVYHNVGTNLIVDMLNDVVTVNGGEIHKVRVATVAGAVTVAKTDHTVVVNKASGEATTVNLPASPATGETHVIKDGKGDASSNNITITPAAGTIDGAASVVISTNYGLREVQYDGFTWRVMRSF